MATADWERINGRLSAIEAKLYRELTGAALAEAHAVVARLTQ